MNGVFGLDLQRDRTVVAVAEGGADGHVRSVGDGYRHLVPNAVGADGTWGSRAAENHLAGVARDADLLDHLTGWRRDPLDREFLRGLGRRLHGYLGHTAPSRANGYAVCAVVPPATTDVVGRFAAADLPEARAVDPRDALVCRWLADVRAPAEFDGPVLVVACGAAWTAVAGYAVHRVAGRPDALEVAPVAGTAGTVGSGFGGLAAVLAGQVVRRCGEGVPAAALLPVLDGVEEFAAALAEHDAAEPVAWEGPLVHRLFGPLRRSRRELVQLTEAAEPCRALVALVSAAIAGRADRPALVLLGGPGAVWPFAGDAVSGLEDLRSGRVGTWRSSAPAFDLAFGAARWPTLRPHFETVTPADGRVPSPRVQAGAEARAERRPARTERPATAPGRPVGTDPAEIDTRPPWERDL